MNSELQTPGSGLWTLNSGTGDKKRKVMSYTLDKKTDPSRPMVYQIRVRGHLGSEWTDWFGGLAVTREDNGDTVLTGPIVDQAALHGLLRKVRDLGMPLLSVNRVKPGRADASDAKVPKAITTVRRRRR